jgi:hypothetical protein
VSHLDVAGNYQTSLDEVDGAAKRIRTPDPRITNALLYRLSYCGALPRKGWAFYPAEPSDERLPTRFVTSRRVFGKANITCSSRPFNSSTTAPPHCFSCAITP